ncbi:MAG: hypothetical protein K8R67_05765 [Desulfobacteraceae bacterium]|nr:hypothetical protein [Desulfobacteraceae bacterium]
MGFRKVKFKLGFVEAEYDIPEKESCDQDHFLQAYSEYRGNRIVYNLWAASLYRNSGYKTMAEDVPLLVEDNYINDRMVKINLTDLKLEWERFPRSAQNGEWFWKDIDGGGLRDRVTKELSQEKCRNDYCYRLIANNLTFCPCRYFQYMDSCENIALKKVSALLEHGTGSKDDTIDSIFPDGSIDPFDLENRYCAVGINTLFITIDSVNKKNSKMFLQQRTENVEAENTTHVLPSGTFQPLHIEDSFHNRDFSFLSNIIREFGEEFFGDRDLMTQQAREVALKDRPGLRAFSRMVELDIVKIYFGGFGLDSLTLKPEIMTIAVCNKRDWDSFIEQKPTTINDEGTLFEVDFSLESIDRLLSGDALLLPAARGCLVLAKRHFKQLMIDTIE